MIEKIDKLRKELKRFYYGYYSVKSDYLSGKKRDLLIRRVYKDFYELFTPEQIMWIHESFENLKLPRGNINYLRTGLTIQYLEKRAIEEITEIQYELDSKKHSPISFAESWFRVLTSSDKPVRNEAMGFIEKKLYSLIPLYEHLWANWYAVPAETNCRNLSEFTEVHYGTQVEEAAQIAELFLTATDDTYNHNLKKFVELNGSTINETNFAELLYYSGNPHCHDYLPSGLGLKCLEQCLEDLKIEHLSGNLAIRIPAGKELLRGAPNDHVCPVLHSDLIRIILFPTNGYDLYRRIFNSFGRAALYSAVDEEFPLEYIYMGDRAYEWGYGYLFELLMDNEHFWKYYFHCKDIDGTIMLIKLSRLISLRYLCALTLFERKLIVHPQTEPISNLAGSYQSLMKEALHIDVPGSLFLFDRDMRLNAIQALRGFSFASLFSQKMVAKYGNDWFRNKKAGYDIMELLECGTQYPVNDIIKDWGYTSLAIEPMFYIA